MSLGQCSVAGLLQCRTVTRTALRSCESRLPQPALIRMHPSSRDEHAAKRHMRLCRLVFHHSRYSSIICRFRRSCSPIGWTLALSAQSPPKEKEKGTLLRHPPIRRKLAVKALELPLPSPQLVPGSGAQKEIGQVRNHTERERVSKMSRHPD